MASYEQKPPEKDTIGWALFVLGFAGALFVGWVVFPQLLYSRKAQPVNFSHVIHTEDVGMACEDCHYFTGDGYYQGIPSILACADCHTFMQGESEAEQVLVDEYVSQDKQVDWLIYAAQPDNVYFSHAAHVLKAEMDCTTCHRDVSQEKQTPPVHVNRITGYTKTIMKMDVCEDCHAEMGTPNDCFTCHK